jgi:hypothetical protein
MNRRELLRLMPTDGKDQAGAMRIIELGYPTVEPVLPDIVRWLRVADSPVADAFAGFLADLGEPAGEVIAWRGLHPGNIWARHRILRDVLPHWPTDHLRRIAFMLTTTATQPDAYDNDLLAIELLAKHRLADAEWLSSWITFKEQRLSERVARLRQATQAVKRGTTSTE